MPYNHAIRQAKHILHNHTDNTGNNGITRAVPHTSHSDYTQKQPQTATRKTLSYANMVRYGRELNISQTKTTQTTPKQHAMQRTSQDSQYTNTTVGAQTDDTPLASNETLTATVDDTIEQIMGKQEGGWG